LLELVVLLDAPIKRLFSPVMEDSRLETQRGEANFHAILIGIESYADRPLKACVGDVIAVSERLEQTVRPIRTEKLLAPLGPLPQPYLSAGSGVLWPTYDNFTSALRLTICAASAGDGVYIHYSGHGTKEDKPQGEYSNMLTGDLVLVLFEKEQESQPKYLWGTTLAHYLSVMVDKGLVVTLVLDCCFAASVYRREGLELRSLPYDPNLDRRSGDDTLQLVGDFGRPLNNKASSSRDISMQPNWLLNADKHAILAACGPLEEAYEIELDDGRKHGALSYGLVRVLDAPEGPKRRHRDIFDQLRALFLVKRMKLLAH
jgi:hypothetical protein